MYAFKHPPRRFAMWAVAAGLAGSLAGCSSTRLAATWRDPATAPVHFRKTVVAFVTSDEALRRTVEDKMVESIPNSTQSYRFVQSGKAADSTAIRRVFADLGFDGAVIMRVADVDASVMYANGNYWYRDRYGFGSYWGSSWNYAYDPGYMVANRIVSIETQIYALGGDQLVWAARSETTNPQSVRKLTNSVIKHVTKAMRNDGYLARARCTDGSCAIATLTN